MVQWSGEVLAVVIVSLCMLHCVSSSSGTTATIVYAVLSKDDADESTDPETLAASIRSSLYATLLFQCISSTDTHSLAQIPSESDLVGNVSVARVQSANSSIAFAKVEFSNDDVAWLFYSIALNDREDSPLLNDLDIVSAQHTEPQPNDAEPSSATISVTVTIIVTACVFVVFAVVTAFCAHRSAVSQGEVIKFGDLAELELDIQMRFVQRGQQQEEGMGILQRPEDSSTN